MVKNFNEKCTFNSLLIEALGGVGGTAGFGAAALQGLPIFEGCRKFDAFDSILCEVFDALIIIQHWNKKQVKY